MDLPVYFVAPPTGHAAYYFAAGRNDMLVIDDRNGSPKDIKTLIHAARKHGADVILADFERPPSPAAKEILSELAKQFRTAAPAEYGGDGVEPIFCYDPSKECFSEFKTRLPEKCWLELRPVDKTVIYPAKLSTPAEERGDFFSGELQCRYCLTQRVDGYVLHLYDTPETMHKRLERLASGLYGAVGLQNELTEYGF